MSTYDGSAQLVHKISSLEEKLDNLSKTNTSYAKAVGENTEAIVVRTISEVRKASDKEDHDKQRQKKNLLIHRASETSDNTPNKAMDWANAQSSHHYKKDPAFQQRELLCN